MVFKIIMSTICYFISISVLFFTFFLGIFVISTKSETLEFVKHFSTVTPYEIKYPPHDSFDNYEIVYSELVQRHGARNPTEKKMKKFGKMIDILNKYTNIKYTTEWDVKNEGELVQMGAKELQEIGKFYKKEFEKLYKNHSLEQINVTSTFKKRTHDSAVEFLRGFYSDDIEKYSMLFNNDEKQSFKEDNGKISIRNMNKDEDIYLYYHKNCYKYDEFMKQEDIKKESKKYEKQAIQKIADKILKKMKKLKLIKQNVLDNNELYNEFEEKLKKSFADFYRLAQYDYIVNNKTTGIIELFDGKDSEEMSFAKDLETYRTKGTYDTITHYIAIPLFDSIMNNIKSHLPEYYSQQYNKVNKDSNYVGNFRFAHAETVTPLMTLLGINLDDYPLTAKMDNKLKENRKWDMSKISQFSVHFMFVLVKDSHDKYYIKTYFDQLPVKLPACPNDIMCPVDDFFTYYEKYTKDFDFNQYCENEKMKEL